MARRSWSGGGVRPRPATTRGLPAPSAEERDDHAAHAGMPGMLTPLQMTSLEESSGEEFERSSSPP